MQINKINKRIKVLNILNFNGGNGYAFKTNGIFSGCCYL